MRRRPLRVGFGHRCRGPGVDFTTEQKESIEGPGGIVYPRAINLVLPPAGNAEPEHHMIDVPSDLH